ncbi:PREDICTED: complex I intermediate-associated protein 30, mitochondrial [Nicrophorus vespilloides]|uniref:Complex I intermediate-associated protein 30, mitochondrial n=1 Tax=Nicrophorus vespilloides TaxID=110193 RepID=A0ABM1N4H5_NICVS|nr:PREDICTED: complex I intermediate-associated protein 30, mitochondrial [Nicrophorus vespilloides]
MSLLRNLLIKSLPQIRCIHATKALTTFYEKDAKSGYKDSRASPSKTNLIRDGLKELKQEVALWTEEVKDHFDADPVLIYRPGETDIAWRFDQETVNKWIVTSDSDNNEGFSKCKFDLTEHGKGHFHGNLSTRIPKDGRVQRAGYCNIKSLRARKSFKRESYYDWVNYNMLVLKVRGDGRSYIINIATKGYYDIMWNDVYNYILFTRGGPYWQIARIPFSKFFLSSKGRIQDKQYPLPLNRVTSFGFSVGDKIDGPFSLEIDYVGLEFDPNHTEEFAYEMYKTDKFVAGT